MGRSSPTETFGFAEQLINAVLHDVLLGGFTTLLKFSQAAYLLFELFKLFFARGLSVIELLVYCCNELVADVSFFA